jgi:DNA-binding HxlR family transcriptional regulator
MYYATVCGFPASKKSVLTQTEQSNYGQFCPVAMAAEIVCSKWTPLVLRELLSGSTRFNDLRRGVPRMSPTLLSKRLKELEEAGVISARATGRSVTPSTS